LLTSGSNTCRRRDKAAGLDRIGGQAFDAVQVPIGRGHPIQEWHPRAAGGVAAIGAADVGAQVNEMALGGIEDNSGNESTAAYGDVFQT